MDRQVVEGFFDELRKVGQFGGDIDDLYASPNSSIVPTLKRVHNLGKSSSWTDIGPVGQREGREIPYPRVPWEKKAQLYHGSPRRVGVLKPRDEHGDPRVQPSVFASPSRPFALSYSGDKWGDRDISQWTRGGNKAAKVILREARPGAFQDVYAGRKGYLYEVPEKSFKAIPGRRTMKEVTSTEPVRPTKTHEIPDVLKALRETPEVEMHEYNPDAPENRADVRRQVKRMREMDDGGKSYLKWRLENAPPETKRMFEEEMGKQSSLNQLLRGRDLSGLREKTATTILKPEYLAWKKRREQELGRPMTLREKDDELYSSKIPPWEKTAYELQGHKDFQGLPIAIENRKGSVRKGKDSDGNEWRTKMKLPYGYIKGTKGADGEEVDTYVGPDKEAPDTYVVHQRDKETGKYDEDKVMLGFRSKSDAKKAFLAHYDSPQFLGPISRVSMDRLRELVRVKRKLVKIS